LSAPEPRLELRAIDFARHECREDRHITAKAIGMDNYGSVERATSVSAEDSIRES
jgi:hypothetical protein